LESGHNFLEIAWKLKRPPEFLFDGFAGDNTTAESGDPAVGSPINHHYAGVQFPDGGDHCIRRSSGLKHRSHLLYFSYHISNHEQLRRVNIHQYIPIVHFDREALQTDARRIEPNTG